MNPNRTVMALLTPTLTANRYIKAMSSIFQAVDAEGNDIIEEEDAIAAEDIPKESGVELNGLENV